MYLSLCAKCYSNHAADGNDKSHSYMTANIFLFMAEDLMFMKYDNHNA